MNHDYCGYGRGWRIGQSSCRAPGRRGPHPSRRGPLEDGRRAQTRARHRRPSSRPRSARQQRRGLEIHAPATPEGLETTFAVNYLAPFVLSNLLLPVLARNHGMIVNVGSEQHRWVRAIPWDDMQDEKRFQPIEQYSLTKLYLVMFTRELARRAPDVVVSCVSPGFLRTGLSREARGAFRVFLTLARPFQRSPEHGAEAVESVIKARVSGAYFRGSKQVAPSNLALDDASAARLWELSAGWLEPAQLRQ